MSFDEVTEEQFEKALGGEHVGRQLQVLQTLNLAFAGTMILYVVGLAVVAATDLLGTAEEGGDPFLLGILSLVHAVLAFTAWTAARLLFNRFLRTGKVPDGTVQLMLPKDSSDPAVYCYAVVHVASIVRMALFEGAALFGVVVCFLGLATGAIYTQPLYWLNVLSAAVLVVFLGVSYPTRDRLIETFRLKIDGTRELVSASAQNAPDR